MPTHVKQLKGRLAIDADTQQYVLADYLNKKKDRDRKLVCVECVQPLIACIPAARRNYFRHKKGQGHHGCTGETTLHRYGIAYVKARAAIVLPQGPNVYGIGRNDRDLKIIRALDDRALRFLKPALGCGFVPDVLLETSAGIIAVEVVATHDISAEKAEQMRRAGFPCLRIPVLLHRDLDTTHRLIDNGVGFAWIEPNGAHGICAGALLRLRCRLAHRLVSQILGMLWPADPPAPPDESLWEGLRKTARMACYKLVRRIPAPPFHSTCEYWQQRSLDRNYSAQLVID